MNLQASCSPHPTEPDSYLLFLEIAAADQVAPARKPVHLAVAIDVSSSMGGSRLRCATEAVRALIGRLSEEDVLCLLAFDRSVRTLYGPARVDRAGREALLASLGQLKPGVGTALLSAIQKAHDCLRGTYVREARPQAIVLTDGFPSVGPQQPEAFNLAARQASEQGIVTSAVGIGLNYDERVVGSIATGGGGRYSFVDKEADIASALAQHLSDLFSIAAESLTVRVAPSNPITEARLLHRYPTKVGPDGFTVETGPVGRGSPRRLLFILKAAEAPTPNAARIAIGMKGGDSAGEEPDRILSVPVAPAAGPAVEEAVRELWRLTMVDRESDFWCAIHDNERVRAEQTLAAASYALALLEKAGATPAELQAHRARLEDGRAVLDGRLSDEAKEAARKRSHQTNVSTSTSFRTLFGEGEAEE